MVKNNPSAVLTHMLWNISLTPNGVQKLLFNSVYGKVNPDYAYTILGSRNALIYGIIVISIWLFGLFFLIKERRYWWQYWLKDRAIGWLAMLAAFMVAFLVIPTQRPRPSYLFSQGIFLMAFTGMCLVVITHRWPLLKSAATSFVLLCIMIVLPLSLPSIYDRYARERPILEIYERLAPFGEEFNRPNTKFLVTSYTAAMHGYVTHNMLTNPYINLDYSIFDRAPTDMPIDIFLAQQGVNMFYIDEKMWQRMETNPIYQPFLHSPETFGWQVLTYTNSGSNKWMLVQKLH
jgi:hypothetical protein